MPSQTSFPPAVRAGSDWCVFPSLYLRPWLSAMLKAEHSIELERGPALGKAWAPRGWSGHRYWKGSRTVWLRVLLALGLALKAGTVTPKLLPGVRRLREQLMPIVGYSALLGDWPELLKEAKEKAAKVPHQTDLHQDSPFRDGPK